MKFGELLKDAGVTGVKTILTLTKLKKDYGPNNMKLKLLNTYDLFLVESEIAEHAYTILGKVSWIKTFAGKVSYLKFCLFSISSRNASVLFRLTPRRRKQ